MDYKATLNLPKTDFPMKANLAQAEPRMLAWWDSIGIYKRLREATADRPLWILHDGPPYANGNIHMGHVLNKVMKDLVVKSRGMLGFNAVYVPGWDCHGLPIEHQVDKELGLDKAPTDVRRAMDPLEKIGKCRAYANKYVQIQREEFKRLGVFGDWDNPYITMAPAYQAVIAREFGRFVGKGLVYKGLKPVHWCMHDKTALAQAEVEYEEERTQSVYVKFPLVAPLPDAPNAPKPSLVVWTTTPWTLPANLAIAVHPEEDYVVLQVGDESLIVAAKLADAFAQVARLESPRQLAKIPGRRLEGLEYRHAWIDRTGKVAAAPFVAMDTGTGLVHIAPGHGEEDYELGRALGLKIYNPVDDDGRFIAEVEHFAGLTVWEANPKIVAHLERIGALVAEQTLTHTYPHCWRCKNPTLFRATEQWFIALDKDGLRERALRAIRNDVRWIPEWGEERIFNMVAHRPDWTISRQRVWGVPIVAFYCEACDTVLLEERIVEHVARIFREGAGADEWHARSAAALLPPGIRCTKCGSERFRKETDILDVWFDSGCSHAAVLETRPELRWPAELYLEGSDQHRGWFHSSLLEAMGTRNAPPYREVLTCGFVVDGEGRKMSKSLGNVISPLDLMKTMGADILRLWTVSADYAEDLRIGDEILAGQADAYRGLRNTLRFLLGNLAEFREAERLPNEQMPELERWVLHRVSELDQLVREANASFDFPRLYSALHNFCATDLSAFYFDVRKDALYCDPADGVRRRAARTVLDELFRCLTAWLAPVLVFTAEEAWLTRHPDGGSVHLRTFPEVPAEWRDPELGERWERVRRVRRVITGALELERKEKRIGASLQAAPTVYLGEAERAAVEGLDLAELAITSGIELTSGAAPEGAFALEDVPGVAVVPGLAEGEKCARCWQVLPEVAASPEHLCRRCTAAVAALDAR
jgi:isoleucyl-tRNA synthetase